MPAAKPELLETALERLDSVNRALLELWLRQGVKDPELAELMRIDEDEVRRRRDTALDEVADDLGIDQREQLVAALLDHWRGPGKASRTTEPAKADERPSRRGTVIAILVVALLGIATGTLVALITKESDEQTAGPPGRDDVDEPPEPTRPPVALEALPGARRATGEARIRRDGDRARLVMDLKGLADGTYQAWLYDSTSRARPIVRFRHDTTHLDVTVPVDPTHYRSLDVSREQDSNPNHSGASLLRAPIERLVEN